MIPFRNLLHADWSITAKKRWVARAIRTGGGWPVKPPRQIQDTPTLVDELFATPGPVLAGFDFPIGLPSAYGAMTGFSDFLHAFAAFGEGDWAEFFNVCDTPQQISLNRPFYPGGSGRGANWPHLFQGLGLGSWDSLRRQCERKSQTRRAACPLFWTLGGNQVGRAAISGWREVVSPALKRGAKLWPFHGKLVDLLRTECPVLAETYPAEAYGHVGVVFGAMMSKRRQDDRRYALRHLSEWAQRSAIALEEALTTQIEAGFGTDQNGEDAFDALIGLLGMIEVVVARRLESPNGGNRDEAWEGWILGQSA